MLLKVHIEIYYLLVRLLAQLAWALEYTYCISAVEFPDMTLNHLMMRLQSWSFEAQLTGVLEYSDCISAEG